MTNPDAELLESLSYQDVLVQNLRVIDPSAMSLCSENNIPVIVLNIFKDGNITKALYGEKVGTLIS
jgi:uridylate kinase